MSGPDSQSNDQSSQQTIVGGQTAAPDVDYVALKPGQMIGRYEIVSVLGQGGFGITYRARDVQLGREVAIKEYLPSALAIRQDSITVLPRTTKMADDFGWGRERFVTEGRTLASLHRVPAIVQVFDFLEANGTAYIVMELLHGKTLEDRIASDGKVGPEAIDRILWPLLDGLEQVHNAGFLHRDIKPANILLDASGNPTLIDFGASRAAMAGRSTALTAIFTPGYAAAEQMTSARQGPWTDIYGLSATLYHAIAGKVPPSAFDRMLDDGYEPLAQIRPAGFKPGVLAGIDAGLAVAARERPQTIAGWRPILAMTVAPAGDSTVVLGKAPEPAPEAKAEPRPGAKPGERHVPILAGTPAGTPSQRTGLWIAIAAVVLILLGGGGYFAFVPRGPDPAALEARRLADEAAAKQKQAEEEAARLRAENEKRLRAEQEAAEQARQKAEQDRVKAEQEAAEQTRQKAEQDRIKAEQDRAKAEQEAAEQARQKAEQDRIKAEQDRVKAEQAEREAAEQRRLKAEQEAAEQQRRAAAEEEQRKRFEAEAREKIIAEMAAQKRAEEEARRKAEEEAEARRKAVEEARRAIEFVAGTFDHFGKTLMMIGLKDRADEIRLQGVDIVADPDLHQLAVKALAAKPRHLRCRQTDRLTDGTPLYRCLITPLAAKQPLADVPDAERVDLALALVRNGLVLASCDAPRTYADAEDEARGGKQSLWGRVNVPDYKKRCSK